MDMLQAPPRHPSLGDDLPESPWSRLAGALLSAVTLLFEATPARAAEAGPEPRDD